MTFLFFFPQKPTIFLTGKHSFLEKKFMEFNCFFCWPGHFFTHFFVSTFAQEVWGPVNRNGGASAC